MNKSFFLIPLLLSLMACTSQSELKKELKLSNLFSDHMVLQQQQNVEFWGQYNSNGEVKISANWGKEGSVRADAQGNWKVQLPTPAAGGPYTIQIKTADSVIVIKDVLIGEVWLASGQSNMDLPLKGWPPDDTVANSSQEIAQANYPAIRLLKVPFNLSTVPIDSIGGKWIPASPETAGDFSAAAYFFAKKLNEELHVPIGIIQSSIGGTPAEAWTSKESLNQLGDFDDEIKGLENIQASLSKWLDKWPFQTVPSTDEEWKSLRLNDISASKSAFDDSAWNKMSIPGRFDRLNSGEFDGVMWLRRDFLIADLSTDYILKIGSVDDMDQTYINGKKVGGLMGAGFAGTPRKMDIPKSILVKGKNTIAIRVIDSGGPGFVNAPIALFNNNLDTISLDGEWRSRLLAERIKGKFYNYGLESDISKRPDIFQLNSNSPTVLFNAMINPLIPFTIKGVVWYQGESNVGRAEQYKQLFPLMIKDWREKWDSEFPFYFVQIAPYLYTAPDQKGQSQKLRNAQRYALALPKTGMAVTLDIGKLETAHPAYKKEVGNRLARFALANDYGKDLVSSGPLYKGIEKAGHSLLVEFDRKSVGSGLVASESGLSGFEIAGADKNYFPAQATIAGNKVEVKSPEVANPKYVRYAWCDGCAASLFNREGLPASTFSSEE